MDVGRTFDCMATPMSPEWSVPEFTIADRLRKARERTGLDQAPFAAEIDVSKGTVSNYESDRYTHQRKRIVLRAWALRTGVPLHWIETGDAPPTPDDDPGISGESSSACTRSAQVTHLHPIARGFAQAA